MYFYTLKDTFGNDYNMFQVYFDESFWQRADELANNLPIYERSHRGLQANQVGVLGELVAEHYFNHQQIGFIETKNTENDYKFLSGKTIDVKTKDRTVAPRLNFDCSVPLYNHAHQQPDYYLFISLQRSRSDNSEDIRRFKSAYILGAINQKMLHEKGTIWEAGQTDPANGTKFWTSCINVSAKQLVSIEQATQSWREQSIIAA